jgi:hypothetical protein
MSRETAAMLEEALQLSRQLLAAAEHGDGQAVALLDAQRRQLLKSARNGAGAPDAHERLLLQEIALLNDKSIGSLEHHRRIKGRQLDVAIAGRRAVHAYAHAGQMR